MNRTAEVVITGLGPTGLMLAHTLGARGVDVLVVEREPQFYGNARAVYTDAECMRIFQSVGMADRLLEDMLEDVTIEMTLADGTSLGHLHNNDRSLGWAASNFFYQPFLETSLAEGLARFPNVRVVRAHEVHRFEQDADGVDVYIVPTRDAGLYASAAAPAIAGPSFADEQLVRGRYLVGADGGRSTVRTQLGITMSGRSFPNPWLVVDIKAKQGLQGLRHIPNFQFICDPHCPTVNCVQPNGHHRFEFMLTEGQTREEMESLDSVHRHLSRYVDVDQFHILRKLVYTFNALVADRWRDRRVLLAGDAAHMTPQFIGQGMNAGVRDAHNLGWKLHAVLTGQASDTLLDSYEQERRPHASAMIREAVRVKDFVSVAAPWKARARDLVARSALALPVVGAFIKRGGFLPGPKYPRGRYVGMPRRGWRGAEGTLMPQPFVRSIDGRRRRLDDELGRGFVVLGAGVDPRVHVRDFERRHGGQLHLSCAVMYPWGMRPQSQAARQWDSDLQEIEDVTGDWARWLKRSGGGDGWAVVLRPDRFVFAVVPMTQLDAALDELGRQLGEAQAGPAEGPKDVAPAYQHSSWNKEIA